MTGGPAGSSRHPVPGVVLGPAPRSYVLGLGAELGGCGGAGSPVLPVSGITGQGIPQGKEGDGVWRNEVGCLGWGSLGSGETWGTWGMGRMGME